MSKNSLALEIKGIQAQLDSLKSLVSTLKGISRKKKNSISFADLYGIWKGKVDLSLEEIREAEYKSPKNLLR